MGPTDTGSWVDEYAAIAAQTWDALRASRACIEQARALLACTRHGQLAERPVELLTTAAPLPPAERPHRLARVPRPVPCISPRARAILAEAYEIDPGCVGGDAQLLAAWRAPLDEFLVRVCRLRQWDASTGAIYLGALRSALLSGDVICPWVDGGE